MKNTKVTLAPLEAGRIVSSSFLDNQESSSMVRLKNSGCGTIILRRTAKSFPVRRLSKALMHPTARHIEFCMMAERLAVWC